MENEVMQNALIGKRLNGWCKWFSKRKGFGFIVGEEEPLEFFVHFTAIQGDAELKYLKEGQKVEFRVGRNKKGLVAEDVVIKASD